jgi:peptidoglycan hydrolase CwlO-like protein
MAEDEDQRVENAFNTLVSITEKSGNLRKDLKNDILESVSTLRKIFSKMKAQVESKSEEIKKLSEEVMKVTEEIARRRNSLRDRWRHLWTACSIHQEAEPDRCFHLRADENSSRKC